MTKEEKAVLEAAKETEAKKLQEELEKVNAKDEEQTAEVINEETEEVKINFLTCPLYELVGQKFEDTTKILARRSDFEHFANIGIKNVNILRDAEDEQKGISLTLKSPVPQYMPTDLVDDNPDEFGNAKTNTNVIFTSVFQISAMLKESGEIAIASLVVANPQFLATILEGAKISLFSRKYMYGEVEQNPFSSKINDYVVTKNTYRHYPYDIALGNTGKQLKNMILQEQAKLAIGALL